MPPWAVQVHEGFRTPRQFASVQNADYVDLSSPFDFKALRGLGFRCAASCLVWKAVAKKTADYVHSMPQSCTSALTCSCDCCSIQYVRFCFVKYFYKEYPSFSDSFSLGSEPHLRRLQECVCRHGVSIDSVSVGMGPSFGSGSPLGSETERTARPKGTQIFLLPPVCK